MNKKLNTNLDNYFSLIESQDWNKYLKIAMHIANCDNGQIIYLFNDQCKILSKKSDHDIFFPNLIQEYYKFSETDVIEHPNSFVSFKISTSIKNLTFFVQLKVEEMLSPNKKEVIKIGISQIEDTLLGLLKNAKLNQKIFKLSKSHEVIENLLSTFGHLTLIFNEKAIIEKVFGNRKLILYPPELLTGKSIYNIPELKNIKEELKQKIRKYKNKDEAFTIFYSLTKENQKHYFKANTKSFSNETTNSRYFITFILDITEQVIAKKEIEETNELLTETGKLASVGAWKIDLKTKTIFCSKVTRDIIDIQKSEISFKNFLDLLKDSSAKQKIYQLIRDSMLKRQSNTSEFLINNFNKKQIWVNIKVNVDFEDNNLVKLYGSIQDISSFKKVENQLIQEQNRLSHIIEGSDLGAWEWNAITDYSIHNDKWARILGYEPEEILPIDAKKWEKLIHPDDIKKYNDAMALHLKGEKPYYESEIRLKAKDGKYRWILDRGKVISYNEKGQAEKVYGTHRDITKEKLIENSLKDNLNRFKTIFNFSPVGILLSDYGSAKYIEVNQAILNLTGYNKKEFSSLSIWQLSKYPKTDADKKQLKLLTETGVFGPCEKELVKKNGESFIALMQGKSFRTSNGELRVLTIISDVTKEKKVARELKERTRQAKIANKAKSEFLANMSHEMKTPLNGIIGFSDLIANSNLSKTQEMYMRTISSSAQTLKGLISDVLDFSKIEAGKLTLKKQQFNVGQLVREITHVVQHLAFEKDIQLVLNIPVDLPKIVIGDQFKIKQVLINLINNALKFTDEGYVKLSCFLTSISSEKVVIKFCVEDTGRGIQPENKEKILEAFTQEDSSINREKGGTGLGLSISNRLLNLMDSGLQIESRVGEGSKFSFSIQFNHTNQFSETPEFNSNKKIILYKVDDVLSNTLISLFPKIEFENYKIQNEVKDDYDFVLIDFKHCYLENQLNQIVNEFKTQKIIVLIDSNVPEKLIFNYEAKNINQFIFQPFLPNDFINLINQFSQNLKPKNNLYKSSIQNKNLVELTFLIVEDNQVNMQLLHTYLNNLYSGIKIYCATNGIEALEIFKTKKIDILITDIQMPEMNGFVLSKRIRKLKKGRHVPIIAITAGQISNHLEISKKAGININLSKPILQNELKLKIQPFIESILNVKDQAKIDLPHIEQLLGNDKNEIVSFLKMSKESLEESKQNIIRELKLEDYKKLAKSFHKLKGTLLYLNLNKMSQTAEEIQQKTKAENKDALKQIHSFLIFLDELINNHQKNLKNLTS